MKTEMPIRYAKKKRRSTVVVYTILTVLLISFAFSGVIAGMYVSTEEEAKEMLHIQTKQIKDDLTLQMVSDRENLITMSNFASKLHTDGESYDRLFESFKPIGLFANIGIMTPENTFITKDGEFDLNGKISFADQEKLGIHISERSNAITGDYGQVIRSGVPIVSNGKTVGILYGIIPVKTINDRYRQMASELDAQLFVYEKNSGNFVIDTIHENFANVSEFKNRTYTGDHSYEELITNENGYSSFMSIYRDEELYLHYSTIEDFDWGIMLGRYESQVFAKANETRNALLEFFFFMILIMLLYLAFVLRGERRKAGTTKMASDIRKLLLEINQQHGNIHEALKMVMKYAAARSAFFVDSDGEFFHYIHQAYKDNLICGEERDFLVSELFHFEANVHNINRTPVVTMGIKRNLYLKKKNEDLYKFLKEQKIKDITFVAITDKNNHVSILGVLNKKNRAARVLLEDIAVCFSIAIFNKKHLNKTEVAATTDALTGVPNRVSYKRDIVIFDEEKPLDFSCIYVDVNELHIRNSKYGHAAGDEMLVYIANTLKEVFYGQYVYRMGGDEFLVFIKETSQEHVKELVELFIESLKQTEYNVAIGTSYRAQNMNCDELVREAEIRMYEAKAQYYHNKEQISISNTEDKSYTQIKTGILEIDTMISVLKEHYNGIYRVNLDTDSARRILMPAYLGYNEYEENFSRLVRKYIDETVHQDFHRSVSSFLNYSAIRRQLLDGKIPRITYKKMNGEIVVLSIYNLSGKQDEVRDTLWVFSKA